MIAGEHLKYFLNIYTSVGRGWGYPRTLGC